MANRPLIKLYLSGEPLLHEGLFAMIEYAGSKGCRTMVHTNATLLTRETAERMLSSSLTFLCFSFDGCSAEVYERLRPPSQFEQVKSNILQYLALRRERGGAGPRTRIEIIRMGETAEMLDGFASEWQGSGVDDVHIAEYTTWHGLVPDRCASRPPRVRPATNPVRLRSRTAAFWRMGPSSRAASTSMAACPWGTSQPADSRKSGPAVNTGSCGLQMLTGTFPPDSICDRCDNIVRNA